MKQIATDKKKYVLTPQKEFEILQIKTALQIKLVKKHSLVAGIKHAHKLIDKWAKGK